jgi:exonuclease III
MRARTSHTPGSDPGGGQTDLQEYRGAPDRCACDVPARPATSIRVNSMNMRGAKSNRDKRRATRPLITGNSAVPPGDIVLLQETVVSGDDRGKPLEPELAQQYADDMGPECRSYWTGHCGVLLSATMDAWSATPSCMLDGRLLLVKLTKDDTVVHVACIYAPAQPTPRNTFLSRLHQVLEDTVDCTRLVVGGDWNIVPDVHDLHNRMGGRVLPGEGTAMWEAMADSDALDLAELLGTRKPARSFGDLTWTSPLKNGLRIRRRLDWFAVSRGMLDDFDPDSIDTIPVWFSVPDRDADVAGTTTAGTDHATITAVFTPHASTPQPTSRLPSMSWYVAQRYPAESGFESAICTTVDNCYERIAAIYDSDKLTGKDVPAAQADETALRLFDKLHEDISMTYEAHRKLVNKLSKREAAAELKAMQDLYSRHTDPDGWGQVEEELQAAQDAVRDAVEREARRVSLDLAIEASHNHEHHRHVRNTQTGTNRQMNFTSQKVFSPAPDEHHLDNLHDVKLRRDLHDGPGWSPMQTSDDRPTSPVTDTDYGRHEAHAGKQPTILRGALLETTHPHRVPGHARGGDTS